MSTKSTELTRWNPGPHYFGDRFDDYYVILSKSRDSDAAERSNFDATVKLLGENGKVIRAAHFLVGWMEQILVHEKNKDGIRTAEDILRKLKDYPVLDEDLYCRYEEEEDMPMIRRKISEIIRIPTAWGMFTKAGDRALTRKASGLVEKLDRTTSQTTRENAYLAYLRSYRRMEDTKNFGEASDTDVREQVWDFFEKLCNQTDHDADALWDSPKSSPSWSRKRGKSDE